MMTASHLVMDEEIIPLLSKMRKASFTTDSGRSTPLTTRAARMNSTGDVKSNRHSSTVSWSKRAIATYLR